MAKDELKIQDDNCNSMIFDTLKLRAQKNWYLKIFFKMESLYDEMESLSDV